MKKTVKKVELYKASIKIFGKTFQAEGKTLIEAVSNLKPGNVKGISVLTISKGKLSKDRIITPPQTFRLFSPSPMMREIALKNVLLRFDI